MTNIRIKDYFSRIGNEDKEKNNYISLKKSYKGDLEAPKSDFL